MKSDFATTVEHVSKQVYNKSNNVSVNTEHHVVDRLLPTVSQVKNMDRVYGLVYEHENGQHTFATFRRKTETIGRHAPKEQVRENTYVEVKFYRVFVPDDMEIDEDSVTTTVDTIDHSEPDDTGYYSGYRLRTLDDAIDNYYEEWIKPYHYMLDSLVYGNHAAYSTPTDAKETIVGGGEENWEPNHNKWPRSWIPAVVGGEEVGQRDVDTLYHRGIFYHSDYEEQHNDTLTTEEENSILNNRRQAN